MRGLNESKQTSDRSSRRRSAILETAMHCSAVLFFLLVLPRPRPAAAVGAPAPAPGRSMSITPPPLLPCLEEVLPCTAYLKSAGRPAPTCCTALGRAAATEMSCICQLLADPGMLADFNVSREQALALPTRCRLPVGCRDSSVGMPDPVVQAPPPPPPAIRTAPRNTHAGDPSPLGGDRCRTGSAWRAVWTMLFGELFSIAVLL
ncbi:non-specific lipid transfer protein GPI-anchored 15-like [Triticum aestivum]|uniref:non-specific lipid transfer protein GPI-anchored 15-like n=1 Tax=Triticum aestivum TaxID=4565 RepID=UPI001D021637|nr:non-specific lipid transfer protein GPI-anchored 15-like [Triticum aestivum]